MPTIPAPDSDAMHLLLLGITAFGALLGGVASAVVLAVTSFAYLATRAVKQDVKSVLANDEANAAVVNAQIRACMVEVAALRAEVAAARKGDAPTLPG
jgi:ubiquinone biosynthesis protein UbiJ